MRSQKSGTIINISSSVGVKPQPSMSIYGASKWALEGMSEGLAKEIAPFGIRVLIVQPGAFTTNMINAVRLTQKPLSDVYRNTQVAEFVGAFGENATFTAPNNVEKGCQAIFEVVTGTGRGADKENYIRMPLSKDCARETREHIKILEEGYDVFRDIWESTEHDGGVLKAFGR